ncbi:MAG: lamin tail domain-containing protein, partial [Oscillospiraceae bacterium]|nr:lamin tail domain-containing protein [Oscillospiraceae bacterium]
MKKRLSLFFSFILILFLLCGCGQEPETPAVTPVPAPSPVPDPDISVRISEVMSANKTVLTDEQGTFPDWIELFNTGSDPCDLEGCWLSNDPSVPKKWQFSSLVLAPGERCIVFCAGKNASASPSSMNASFALK